MENWIQEIKSSNDEYLKRKKEITTLLEELALDITKQLKIGTDLKQNSDYPLSWNIRIGFKEFSLSESEISEKELPRDSWGRSEEKAPSKPLADALKELLVEKFTE